MRLVTLPGVFRPISDTWLLADALDAEDLPARARVLDLCSGSGALALRAARRADTTAVDVSRRAVATIRLNAALNGVKVRALRGDLFDAVRGERFDAIVSNPPYVPAPTDDCTIPAAGGYRGTENRLYRVEIHQGGALGAATFKWARHNASVGTAVTAIDTAATELPDGRERGSEPRTLQRTRLREARLKTSS